MAHEGAQRQREVEVAGNQHRLEVGAPLGHADGLDDRQLPCRERPQQPVLAPRSPHRQLLERVEDAVVLDEAHDVARDAAHHVDEPLALPLLERQLPGQVEEVGVPRAGDELERRHSRH